MAFRNERILIGDKAREYLEKDPGNVFGSFKRKMGTDASYWVESIEQTRTPIDLSTMILKELRNFIYTGESPDAVVITIPASFDTIQSNATKQAGYNAGFREVLLLQEPIAASLAFVNKTSQQDDKKWLVYDLGGGTFDVALVETQLGEMKILDHEGDNFLVGSTSITSSSTASSFYLNSWPHSIISRKEPTAAPANTTSYLHFTEEGRRSKSNTIISTIGAIEFEIDYLAARGRMSADEITRARFEDTIASWSSETGMYISIPAHRTRDADLDCILLVGGSTYIPCVREWISTTSQYTGIHIHRADKRYCAWRRLFCRYQEEAGCRYWPLLQPRC